MTPRWLPIALACAAAATPALGGELPGEDDALYRCKRLAARETIAATLAPEADLKELVVWVTAFTCKSFIFDHALGRSTAKVALAAPPQLTPPEAYRLFLSGLRQMNLTVVPFGSQGTTLEIRAATTAPRPAPSTKSRTTKRPVKTDDPIK
jgi:hypothetical protein